MAVWACSVKDSENEAMKRVAITLQRFYRGAVARRYTNSLREP